MFTNLQQNYDYSRSTLAESNLRKLPKDNRRITLDGFTQ